MSEPSKIFPNSNHHIIEDGISMYTFLDTRFKTINRYNTGKNYGVANCGRTMLLTLKISGKALVESSNPNYTRIIVYCCLLQNVLIYHGKSVPNNTKIKFR